MWLKAFMGASAVLSVGVAAAYWLRFGPQVPAIPLASATPVACTLNPDQLATRRQELVSFSARARQIRELDDGYAFHFAFDEATLEAATRVISAESGCCSFLCYRLTARPSEDLLLLEITGPEGTKQLLSAGVRAESAGPRPAANSRLESGTPACCPTDGSCTETDCLPAAGAN